MFAYGQTGSGKTHTMTGVLQRLSRDMDHLDQNLSLYITFVQLLGNNVTDLLVDSDDNNNSKVSIMEDKLGKISIQGATEVPINDINEFTKLTNDAMARRSTSTTFKNDTSSRSHAVCRLRLENTKIKSAEDGFLFLIDLAGSENAADSQFHDRARIQETKDINKSLMCLKDCIRNRARASADPGTFVHIPYRQSKLSLLLKDAFELESYKPSRTVVIATIAPTIADLSMTLNTLR